MARQWSSVTVEEAKKHPLYGIKGWLACFVLVISMGTIGQIGTMSNEARGAGMTLGQLLSIDQPATTVLKATIVIDLLAFAIVVGLLSVKHKAFRLVTSGVLIALSLSTLIMGVATSDKAIGGQLATDFMTRTFWGAVWIAYLNRSKRVRVTFEKTVLAHENINQVSASQV